MKTRAKGFEDAARASLLELGVDLVEISDWNCCGVVYSLAEDDLIHHLAPVRNLIRAHQQGSDRVVTLCAMCYNTLARVNLMMRHDTEKREKINRFMYEEPDYHGEVEVYHLLSLLSREIGWETIRDHVKVSLAGLSLVPYYGCMLTRPRDVAIEPSRNFALFTNLLQCLGATVPYFKAADRCCGSYQSVNDPQAAGAATAFILEAASRAGAEALALTCPLCEFNLSHQQQELTAGEQLQTHVPIYYFSQLLAVALGLNPGLDLFDMNPEAVELLVEKGFRAHAEIRWSAV